MKLRLLVIGFILALGSFSYAQQETVDVDALMGMKPTGPVSGQFDFQPMDSSYDQFCNGKTQIGSFSVDMLVFYRLASGSCTEWVTVPVRYNCSDFTPQDDTPPNAFNPTHDSDGNDLCGPENAGPELRAAVSEYQKRLKQNLGSSSICELTNKLIHNIGPDIRKTREYSDALNQSRLSAQVKACAEANSDIAEAMADHSAPHPITPKTPAASTASGKGGLMGPFYGSDFTIEIPLEPPSSQYVHYMVGSTIKIYRFGNTKPAVPTTEEVAMLNAEQAGNVFPDDKISGTIYYTDKPPEERNSQIVGEGTPFTLTVSGEGFQRSISQ